MSTKTALHALVACLVVFGVCLPAAAKEDQAIVVVFDGYGGPGWFVVSGRVLEDHGGAPPSRRDGAIANLVGNLQALESDELRAVDVVVRVHGASYAATTDADGNFTVKVANLAGAAQLTPGANPVEAELTEEGWRAPVGRGFVHVVAPGPGVGLISDVDDTIVKTYVTSKRRLAATVLLKNGHQLEPVIGAAANYAAAAKSGVAAFFYLSGSPQNLYPRLRMFLDDNDFPAGALFLKNLGDDQLFAQDEYKLARLEQILAAYPDLRFVLVGDNGERDPEIYAALRKRHPQRVAAIVLRKTPGSTSVEPARFADMVVVDDVYADEHVIADLVAAAAARLAPSSVPSASSLAPAGGNAGTKPPATPASP